MSVREPDEATIRAALRSLQLLDSRLGGTEALKALDRLVADRLDADAERVAWEKTTMSIGAEHKKQFDRAVTAWAEVAVLTARLEASENARAWWEQKLSDFGKQSHEDYVVLTARLTEADEALRQERAAITAKAIHWRKERDDLLARAALAGERGDRHNEDGGNVNVARDESGQA